GRRARGGRGGGISAEFVQIALAEAATSGRPALATTRVDALGSKVFLGATCRTIDATATVRGGVDVVSAATLQVFCGHPCLLQAGEVAELPSSRRRRRVPSRRTEYPRNATRRPARCCTLP